MKITVLGTGIMGAGVAGSLLRAGHDVTVWNRDAAKAAPLAAVGATVAPTPGDAVAHAEAVLTVLFDGDAVVDVMAEAVEAMPAAAIWVQLSTIGLADIARAAELAARHGVSFVDSPMLGTKTPAETGKLVLLVSGDQALIDRLAPVFEAISIRTVNAGPTIGAASALKLAANAWVQSVTALIGQSMALTKSFGLDPQLFLDAISGGAIDTPYAHIKGAAIIANDYPPSFTIDGTIKDLGLIRTAARDVGVAGDVLAAVEARFTAASRAGHGAEDMAAVYTAFLPPAAPA
jgi:3-hydroxyisobutyrate dehydrogenase